MLDFLRDFMFFQEILYWIFARIYVFLRDFKLEKFLEIIKKLLKSLPAGF